MHHSRTVRLDSHYPLPPFPPMLAHVLLGSAKHGGFVLQQSKVKRRHLRLDKQPALHWAQPEQQQQGAVQDDTFTSMLTNLVYSRTLARTARAVGMLPLLLQLALQLVVLRQLSYQKWALSCPHATCAAILHFKFCVAFFQRHSCTIVLYVRGVQLPASVFKCAQNGSQADMCCQAKSPHVYSSG